MNKTRTVKVRITDSTIEVPVIGYRGATKPIGPTKPLKLKRTSGTIEIRVPKARPESDITAITVPKKPRTRGEGPKPR